MNIVILAALILSYVKQGKVMKQPEVLDVNEVTAQPTDQEPLAE
ncbi:hypothetical protein OL548_31720 [Lysinibacillus sp. MHQ-1]|nr:hypothetical protein OL548_31720 [Lysinibacillus sp. MHQ-1]